MLLEVLGSGPNRRLLDLGCGTGEHARFLVDQGFEVVGIDRSASMIDKARDTPLPPGLDFRQGDLTALREIVDSGYGGAICLGNTLPHIRIESELRAFLAALRAVLLPDAPVIVQLLNYDRIFELGLRHLPINIRDDDDGGEIVFLRLMELEEDGGVVFYPSTLELRPDADPPLAVRAAKRVHLHGWRKNELERLLVEVGFDERRWLGSFAEEAFDDRLSSDLIVVAR